MNRDLSFRHVEVIRAVVATGTVTGAAVRLHVTQPAISNVIKDAEARLGFALFERAGGRIMPTEKARLLADEIERAFTGLDLINEMAARLSHAENRRLHIVTTPSFGATVLPRVIRQFRARYPRVRLSLSSKASNLVQAMVASQKADIGFGLAVPTIPSVAQQEILATPLYCIVARDHPLANHGQVDPELLRGHDMISFSHLHEGTPDQEACLFAEPLCAPEPVVDCAALITTCALVAEGVGFALTHSLALSLFRHAGLRAIPFTPPTELAVCAYRSHANLYPGAQLDYLVELAAQTSQAIDTDFHTGRSVSETRLTPTQAP